MAVQVANVWDFLGKNSFSNNLQLSVQRTLSCCSRFSLHVEKYVTARYSKVVVPQFGFAFVSQGLRKLLHVLSDFQRLRCYVKLHEETGHVSKCIPGYG